jgi:hypothetical protein
MRLLSLALIVGCAGPSAEAPLRVKLGVSRDQTTTELRAAQFCHKDEGGAPQKVVTYPRCERAATEWGESWVTAKYDDNKLVELRRYERFTEDDRAIERWNQLIADRAKISAESPDAAAALRSKGLEPGTRTMKAFRVDADTVVAVYLLTPTPPEEASVLEAIVRLTPP